MPRSSRLLAQAVQQRRLGGGAVVLAQRGPGGGLGGLYPGQHIAREEGACTVVTGSIALGMQPACGRQISADLVFEVDLAVQRHGAWRVQKSAGVRMG